jgi:hypothetical protein
MNETTKSGKDSKDTANSSSRLIGTLGAHLAVSTSLALVATSAMAQAGSEQKVSLNGDDAVSPELDQAISAALGKKSVREAVSASFDVFVSNMERNGTTLADDYFDGMPFQDWRVAATTTDDSTDVTGSGGPNQNQGGGFSCYSNCHGACHGACHGSRGWR